MATKKSNSATTRAKPTTPKPTGKPAGAKPLPAKAAAKPASKTAVPTSSHAVPRAAKVSVPSRPSTSSAIQPLPLPTLRPGSKQSQLLEILGTGATMAQMMELTGWQAHTLRATLSAVFRKRLKLNIEGVTPSGESTRIYRITGLAA